MAEKLELEMLKFCVYWNLKSPFVAKLTPWTVRPSMSKLLVREKWRKVPRAKVEELSVVSMR